MDLQKLSQFMDAQIAKGVPGCELIVHLDHKEIFHEVRGTSDVEGKRKAAFTDRYRFYSCTKPLTATCAQIACEMGLLAIDDPMEKYLPEFADTPVLGEDGKPHPRKNPLTIRNLLTMTGGFDYDWNCKEITDALSEDPDADMVALMTALAKKPLNFEPGTHYRYSLCHDVFSAVLQKASGRNLLDFMKKHIFEKLGMESCDFARTGFTYADMAARWKYAPESGFTPDVTDGGHTVSSNCFSGGAGLIATASDYMRFADSLACDETLITRASLNNMRTPQVLAFGDLGFSCTVDDDYDYCLGVRTRSRLSHGVKCARGEFGWDGAAGADLTVDPDNRVAVVWTENVLGWTALQGADLHTQLRDVVYPALGLAD